jgi:hypothetical protein
MIHAPGYKIVSKPLQPEYLYSLFASGAFVLPPGPSFVAAIRGEIIVSGPDSRFRQLASRSFAVQKNRRRIGDRRTTVGCLRLRIHHKAPGHMLLIVK